MGFMNGFGGYPFSVILLWLDFKGEHMNFKIKVPGTGDSGTREQLTPIRSLFGCF